MSTIDEVFGEAGLLAKRFAGYAPRAGQVAFAKAVRDLIASLPPPPPPRQEGDGDDGEYDQVDPDGEERPMCPVLVAECPTGVGKSIGYLVPAIQEAVARGRHVIVATANIALQEQLVGKDLPSLRAILPEQFSFALMKGLNNYLCPAKARSDREMADAAARDPLKAKALKVWAGETKTGDKSELPFEPEAVWQHFSTGSADCKGKKCSHYERCPGKLARKRAASATVVVCNYHVLLMHLVLLARTGKHILLPELDVVILDEAHKLAEIARDFFGFQVTEGRIRHRTRLLDDVGASGLRASIDGEAAAYFSALLAYRQSKRYKARLRRAGEVDASAVVSSIKEGSAELLKAATTWPQERLREMGENFGLDLRKGASQLDEMAADILQATNADGSKGDVYYIDEERGRASLKSMPIDVAPKLRATLLIEARAVVCTSATLAVGGKFDHYCKETGVRAPRTLVAASPFDHFEQAVIVVPDGLPDAKGDRDKYRVEVARILAEVVRRARGRTLGLFTSHRALKDAREALAGCGYRVLVQGDDQRMRLVQQFKDDVSSVLLGTESFWAGVDVPGEALSCVVIDRLPFSPPDDPLMDAISERDPEGWFFNAALPRSVIQVKQGAGRLIRAVGDRGAIVILDKRIVEKSYGRTYLRSMPRMRVETSLDAIDRILAG